MTCYSSLIARTLDLKDVKCEFRYDSTKVGLVNPVFSWKLVSDSRDVMQTAYQIQVATARTVQFSAFMGSRMTRIERMTADFYYLDIDKYGSKK